MDERTVDEFSENSFDENIIEPNHTRKPISTNVSSTPSIVACIECGCEIESYARECSSCHAQACLSCAKSYWKWSMTKGTAVHCCLQCVPRPSDISCQTEPRLSHTACQTESHSSDVACQSEQDIDANALEEALDQIRQLQIAFESLLIDRAEQILKSHDVNLPFVITLLDMADASCCADSNTFKKQALKATALKQLDQRCEDMIQRAQVAFEDKRYDLAVHLYESVLSLKPDCPVVCTQLIEAKVERMHDEEKRTLQQDACVDCVKQREEIGIAHSDLEMVHKNILFEMSAAEKLGNTNVIDAFTRVLTASSAMYAI